VHVFVKSVMISYDIAKGILIFLEHELFIIKHIFQISIFHNLYSLKV